MPHVPETLTAALLAGQPDRPAICADAATLTHGELAALVASSAAAIAGFGVGAGDRVLLIFPNSTEHIVALLSVTALGAIAVPVSPRAGRRRLRRIVEDTSPRLCLAHPDAHVPAGIATRRLSVDHGAAAVSFSPSPPPRARRGAPPPITADCAALILFTSGSTGEPVGVTLKHRHLTWTARALAAAFELDADHRELIVAPLAHSGAWQRAAATLVGGGCVAFWNGLPSVVGILEEIERLEVTGFFTAPPLLRTILAAPRGVVGRGLRRCRSIEIGSAAVSPAELRLLLELAPGARVFVHYGLTECSRAAILDVRAHPDKLDTVGRCLPGVEVAIRDAEGRNLPRGRRGRIYLRGPQAAESYWARPELERNRRGDTWLETKDHGALDAEGFLKFLGREDDMINSGGYSFFPAEVEMEIGVVENVAQYVVAGVVDPRGILEQVPWAFVVPVDAERWHPRDFLSIARERLPAYMIPRRVVCVAELPLTASGKPDRRRAVAMYFRTMEG